MEVLGPTLGEIASQKAGILPVGGRAVAALPREPDVLHAIRAEQIRRRCTLQLVDVEAAERTAATCAEGTRLRLPGRPAMTLGLVGRHQAGNAWLALRAVGAIAARDDWDLDPVAVQHGLRSANLPGRFERRRISGRSVLLDGAHNPIKLGALVATLHELHPGARFPWVLAFKQDKDLDAAMRVVAPAASAVVATEFRTDGGDHPASTSLPAERVAAAAESHGLTAVVDRSPTAAVARAVEADAGVPVVVSGSFHLLAAVDRALGLP